MDTAADFDALGFHLFGSPLDVMLLHLEVGNTKRHQSAGDFVFLKERDSMSCAVELL